MTEPTAEQVEREREGARSLWATMMDGADLHGIHHAIATALARVRIEAHAAGRDEGLREAEEIVVQNGWDTQATRDELRALRGRT